MRRSASSASSANLEGLLRESSAVREEVIARAPPAEPQRQDIVLPPKASLKPSHLVTTWQRWSSVAHELAGKKTQQQLMQVGTIGVVILLRTLLQASQLTFHATANKPKQTAKLVSFQYVCYILRLEPTCTLSSAVSIVRLQQSYQACCSAHASHNRTVGYAAKWHLAVVSLLYISHLLPLVDLACCPCRTG